MEIAAPFVQNSNRFTVRARALRAQSSGRRPIVLLAVAGIGALLFTLVAGLLVYANSQSLAAAKDWVEHTQEVLTSLQTASRLADRYEFSTRLYALGHEEGQLDAARRAAVSLETTTLRIRNLVADNPGQIRLSGNLDVCASLLAKGVGGPPQAAATGTLLRCRETISLMTEEEQSLLQQRHETSRHSSVVSITTECAFIGLSLVTLSVLFSFLLRDALLRQRIAQDTERINRNLETSIHALEEKVYESRLLTACRDELQLCVNVKQVYRTAADCLGRLLPRSSGSLSIMSGSRQMLEVVSSWGDPMQPPLVASSFEAGACCGLRLGQLRIRALGMSEVDCTHFNMGVPSRYLCAPLVAQGATLGMLSIECSEDAVYELMQQRMDGVRQLLQLTGMAVASLNLSARLENQSVRDPLTGLFNRHFMQMALERELANAQRESSPLAVFMIDVDHFKSFNDMHGHGAGDRMLQAIAEAFTSSVRGQDTVCRYGGEEFAIIVPGVDALAAFERAERIRAAVGRLHMAVESGTFVEASVSIGIALYPYDAAEPELLLKKADQALYRAKRNGRNQVSVAQTLKIS